MLGWNVMVCNLAYIYTNDAIIKIIIKFIWPKTVNYAITYVAMEYRL